MFSYNVMECLQGLFILYRFLVGLFKFVIKILPDENVDMYNKYTCDCHVIQPGWRDMPFYCSVVILLYPWIIFRNQKRYRISTLHHLLKKTAWYANSISQKWGIFSSPVAIASFIEQMMPFCNIFLAIYIFVVKHKWVVHAFQCNKSVRCGYLYSANSSKDRDDALSSLRIGNKTKI